MKKLILLTAVIFSAYLASAIYNNNPVIAEPVKAQAIEEPQKYVPTHAQDVWLHALEWCESRGKQGAINPEDRDGTPSYYSFQFKPSTFKAYSIKYKILTKEQLDTDEKIMKQMSIYNNQLMIVTEMLNDPKVKWSNEFPDCTKRKIGLPPRY